MATYVKKSDGWAARIRVRGRPEVYEPGFRIKQDAKDWAAEHEAALRKSPKMKGMGPKNTTLAKALTDYVKAVIRRLRRCCLRCPGSKRAQGVVAGVRIVQAQRVIDVEEQRRAAVGDWRRLLGHSGRLSASCGGRCGTFGA